MKAQIEADKKARAEKAAREKALREGKPFEPSASGSSAPAPAAATSTAPKTAGKDYPETRLQIRMASGGQPYTTTLPSDASACVSCLSSGRAGANADASYTALREVAEFLAGQTLAVDVETVSFSLTFPRCVTVAEARLFMLTGGMHDV